MHFPKRYDTHDRHTGGRLLGFTMQLGLHKRPGLFADRRKRFPATTFAIPASIRTRLLSSAIRSTWWYNLLYIQKFWKCKIIDRPLRYKYTYFRSDLRWGVLRNDNVDRWRRHEFNGQPSGERRWTSVPSGWNGGSGAVRSGRQATDDGEQERAEKNAKH